MNAVLFHLTFFKSFTATVRHLCVAIQKTVVTGGHSMAWNSVNSVAGDWSSNTVNSGRESVATTLSPDLLSTFRIRRERSNSSFWSTITLSSIYMRSERLGTKSPNETYPRYSHLRSATVSGYLGIEELLLCHQRLLLHNASMWVFRKPKLSTLSPVY